MTLRIHSFDDRKIFMASQFDWFQACLPSFTIIWSIVGTKLGHRVNDPAADVELLSNCMPGFRVWRYETTWLHRVVLYMPMTVELGVASGLAPSPWVSCAEIQDATGRHPPPAT